ncbi:MAG: MMPL family transporter [Candidatus Poseidoniaceae archaeon]|tara:strand:+ start:5504 stop:8524 length:3021 start_codon:yes stop_codon:yes gene_type:complete
MVEKDASKTPEKPQERLSDRIGNLADYSRSRLQSSAIDLTARVKEFKPKEALDAVLEAPDRFKREWQKNGATGAITRFPLATIIIFLMLTAFFMTQSGFLDNTRFDDDLENPALNVNGDLEVYLPDGSKIAALLGKVEEDWTTNVMVIYIESESRNITDQRVLQEISFVEKDLNPELSDPSDDVIYILSISTVLKEVNSSAPRVRKAFVDQVGQLGCGVQQEDCTSAAFTDALNSILDDTTSEFEGGYEIPSQTTIDLVIGEMYEDDGTPTPGLDKLARDITDGAEGEADGTLDRAIMAIAVTEDKPAKEIIENTQSRLDLISQLERPCEFNADGTAAGTERCTWEDLGLTMTLTGPVPITNSVTEFSFKLFWQIFPSAIILVAMGLFVFHSDILQAGLTGIRPIQGIKVVIISGLPTLCAVFWTLGIIGWTNYEVTMTVIIVGPILLALGVSYGLHITNRYAEEDGTKSEKMKASLNSTGKAVFLSAVTTVIGFISLVFTPMAPIQTVGIALSGGIVVVYILTMFMVPNLTLLLDLRKPKHPPLRAFEILVEVPMKRNVGVITVFVLLILFSATIGQANVEENIDLLGMAPEGELPVIKMKQYSSEFSSGQIGMVLVEANITGDTQDSDSTNDDPAGNLQAIDELEGLLNTVDNTTAVSIVFLMKSTGIAVTVEDFGLNEIIQANPLIPEDIRQTAAVLLDNSVTQDASFWDLLMAPDDFGLPGGSQSEIFLLNVFYASITDETREIFINKDFSRNLIYVDMPYLPVAATSKMVIAVNDYTREFEGTSIGDEANDLAGVASTAIEVNELIVGSQWTSLGFAIVLTLITLAVVFKDVQYSLWTTSPVIATVAMQWLVMWQMDVPLSLVTVMIGSILVGVGVDFSIHISNRIRELGGGIDAIRSAAIGTGMSLFEAAVVTTLGMLTAYQIPIPEIKPFVTVILILLWVAAASALFLLPAIFVTLENMGLGAVSGRTAMAKRLGLGNTKSMDVDVLDAALVDDVVDAW